MTLDALKTAVWKKVKGNENIAKANHHYEDIRKAILKETGYRVSKDTIRNFLESRHDPQPKVLDIYATFVLGGDKEHPKTYQDFENWIHGKSLYEKFAKFLRKERRGFALIIILLFLIISLVLVVIYKLPRTILTSEPTASVHEDTITTPFEYRFTYTDLPSLEKDGWFLFGDSINTYLWNAYNGGRTGNLVMPTLLGDSWLENRKYQPYVINMLAHPIDCGACCEIVVKINDFNPYQRYQQAGFFLFFSEEEVPSLRFTFSSGIEHNGVSVVLREGKYQSKHLVSGTLYEDRTVISQLKIDSITKKPKPIERLESITLKLIIDDSHYFYLYKRGDEEYDVPIASKKRNLGSPKYLALAAFQGRPDIPYPSLPVADNIEAKFEYVQVRSCGGGRTDQ